MATTQKSICYEEQLLSSYNIKKTQEPSPIFPKIPNFSMHKANFPIKTDTAGSNICSGIEKVKVKIEVNWFWKLIGNSCHDLSAIGCYTVKPASSWQSWVDEF